MPPVPPEEPKVLEIRRYSNRRFYDSSRSKHVTLEEIRQIVQDGRDVRITDASTGEDITARILTQIILDYDQRKIGAFPAAMLHRLIRSSESLLLDFIGKSFENATQVFQESQRSAEEQLQRMAAQTPSAESAARWWQGAFGGVTPPWAMGGAAQPPAAAGRAPSGDLERVVEQLRGQLETVQAELKTLQKNAAEGAPKGRSGGGSSS